MTRLDLLALMGGLGLIGGAQWAILHRPTLTPTTSIAALEDSIGRARRSDSIRLAKWADSLASMPPDTLVRTVTRYVERHRRDTVVMVYADTVALPAQVVRELVVSDSACRTRVDSLRGVVAVDSVRSRIDSVDRVADLDAVKRQRWTWAGWGLLAGLGVCGVVR
jgi:hypothetical protein